MVWRGRKEYLVSGRSLFTGGGGTALGRCAAWAAAAVRRVRARSLEPVDHLAYFWLHHIHVHKNTDVGHEQSKQSIS